MNKSIQIFALIFFGLTSRYQNAQQHVFYLHGRIVEVQGANAVETTMGYGAYKYQAILDSLKKYQFEVLSEVRPSDTKVNKYAEKIVAQIKELLQQGVPAKHITVLGASKGALIAMFVSNYLKNSDINYIFLAACDDGTFENYPDLNFYGNILSIYENSDSNKSCQKFKDRSKGIKHFKEIELSTGLKHGFLYQPYSEWLSPSIKWIKGQFE